MLAQTLFTILVAVPLPALAQTVTQVDPAKTDAYISAMSAVELSIVSMYSSVINEVDTLLPSSVYTDWESTEAAFVLTEFATAAPSEEFAPWITQLPSSIQGTFAAILTEQIVAEQSAAASILQNSSISGTPPSTLTGSGYSNNLAPSLPIPTSSNIGPSTLMSVSSQASANAVSSTSSHNAAMTRGVAMVQVAGVAVGAVAAVVAVL